MEILVSRNNQLTKWIMRYLIISNSLITLHQSTGGCDETGVVLRTTTAYNHTTAGVGSVSKGEFDECIELVTAMVLE